MANFVGTLADLAYPKAALSLLQDSVYMLAFEDGIRAALEEQPGELQNLLTGHEPELMEQSAATHTGSERLPYM